MERLRRALRGVDRAEQPALPVGEALHPVAIVAVVMLVLNDWVLKQQFPGTLVVGKLSDIAGLVFTPVVLTAAIGLLLVGAAHLGARVDPSLTHRRLLAAIIATGTVFAAIKLSPAASELFVRVLATVRPAAVAPDRTDLLALPALAIAYWIGRDELRRIPLGRPAAIHRLGLPAHVALADSRAVGAETEMLGSAIDAWDVPRIDGLLAR